MCAKVVKVKICGVPDLVAAHAAARAGADAVGFVFSASPRRVSPAEARRIAADLPEEIERVAVFRLAPVEEIRRVLDEFPADRVQVEPDADRLAAFGARLLPVVHDDGALQTQTVGLAADRVVVFEPAGRGGRGIRPDWKRAATLARRRPVMLAGGLDPDNVVAAIRAVRPWGVDVSSGVESAPGVKSTARIEAFVAAARRAIIQEA